LKVWINGESKDLSEGTSLADLIQSLGIRPETVVSELNLKIIPAAERSQVRLLEGDRVELIQFVGGG
jgi:thiamine biosynthesis protein ThiS